MEEKQKKFYWHANTSSGGTLSLGLDYEGEVSKEEKEEEIAHGLKECFEHMEHENFIPLNSQWMSSRDIAIRHGKTRQYWEKLLNEGKILYKETSAGRITTDLWVAGYLGNKEEVDNYVKNVREVLRSINNTGRQSGAVCCPVCKEERFEFHVNVGGNTNGVCRKCGFHVHTTN